MCLIIFQYLQSGWLRQYSFRCQPVDYTTNGMRVSITRKINLKDFSIFRFPYSLYFQITQMAETCWWYYISKFTEFFDTLFFLLRKKYEHVSTLHVIHHGCMPFSVSK